MSNEKLLDKLVKLQQKVAQRLDRPDPDRKFSVVYTNIEGIIKFRPYLDNEGELIRSGFKHSYKGRSVNCIGQPNCEVCKRVKELTDSWKGVWVYGSREYAIMYAWIFESTIPVGRHMKVNEIVLLEGQSQFANKVSFHVKDVSSTDDLLEMFDPDAIGLAWQLASRKIKNRWDVSLGYSNKKGAIPHLPDDFPPLRECSFREGQPSSPDKIQEFIKEINDSYERFLGLEGSKSSESHQTISDDRLPSSFSDNTNKEEVSDTTEISKPVEKKIPVTDTFEGKRVATKQPDEKPVCYGNHVDSLLDTECLLCVLESQCEADSVK